MTKNKKGTKIAIIGGSGLDDPQIMAGAEEIEVETPFGRPAAALVVGEIGGREVVVLARHGKDHSIMPTKVPFQANVWALKKIGCSHILATTA
ncbi:MAG: 5'-methylthioadenosine phosphorylase, partial [Candidatus Portnoybacteria bacterium CG_4_10_14_0_2_um_filter_43_36]